MTTEEKLLSMKKQVQKEKVEISRLEGSREQLYKTLKKEHDCDTKEEAVEKLKDMDASLNEKKSLLEAGIEELETKYDWDF